MLMAVALTADGGGGVGGGDGVGSGVGVVGDGGVGNVGAGGFWLMLRRKNNDFSNFILTHLRAQAPPEPAEVAGMSQVLVHSAGDELVRFLSLCDHITEKTEKRATRDITRQTIRFPRNDVDISGHT